MSDPDREYVALRSPDLAAIAQRLCDVGSVLGPEASPEDFLAVLSDACVAEADQLMVVADWFAEQDYRRNG